MIALLLVLSLAGQSQPIARNPQSVLTAAVADFRGGRFAESVEKFDLLVKLVPDDASIVATRHRAVLRRPI